jgi:hypothetical protein
MSSENPISRRQLVTHFGAGIAGVAITAAVPSAQAQTSTGNTAASFVDPTSKYPKPPIRGNRSRGPVWPVR